jgi:hypothetical protein
MVHIKYHQRYFCRVAIKTTKFISTGKPNTSNECKDRKYPVGISGYGVTQHALEMKCMKFFIYKIIILWEDGKQSAAPHNRCLCVKYSRSQAVRPWLPPSLWGLTRTQEPTIYCPLYAWPKAVHKVKHKGSVDSTGHGRIDQRSLAPGHSCILYLHYKNCTII